MARKEERVRQPTSPIGGSKRRRGIHGFTLLETLCVLAIVAMLAAIFVPALPRGTSRSRLESYAVAIAALLKADRNAAVRRSTSIATQIDASARTIRSDTTGQIIQVPNDVVVEALLPARCGRFAENSRVRFFASGMSCGGAIALTRTGIGYEIRVNWLTGGVEIVSLNRS
jgi:general secretion pathway protein H